MSTHRHIDKICVVAVILSLLLCIAFMNGQALGIQPAPRAMGYENRLFDTSRVHTIDIVIDDWDGFLETARSEEYSVCSVVIDGEAVTNVGIRGKGNTSLSSVASMDSNRYSFKIEFDQYDSTKTYHGLDKLSLNNIIQDNTYMKDYLTYRMMGEFGVAAPLCSYAYITVNGQDWGLYLAVEAVEDAFLQRNYGSGYGELYKPDGMDMGGGRGNGKDFEMPDFSQFENADEMKGGRGNGTAVMRPEGFDADVSFAPGQMPDVEGGSRPWPGADGENTVRPDGGGGGMQRPEGGSGGMGSAGTKLQYVDDDPASYSVIFDSAKTDITQADRERLIASLKQLSEYSDLEEVVDIERVLRYFVVHNYVVNGDSYTGNMIHNYYLYEEDGRLSMIPWDYNLAFGTFQGGDAASSVNDDIDEVLSDRPMQAWIFSDEAYTQRYYALYSELLEQVDVQQIVDQAYQLIAPYVQRDPTAFCTYEAFQTGVETLKEFCALRTQSVELQLAGSTETVDTGTLDLSQMGTMGRGKGGFGGQGGERPFEPVARPDGNNAITSGAAGENPQIPDGERPKNQGQAAATENPDVPAEGTRPVGGEFPPGGGMGSDGMTANRQTGMTATHAVLLAGSALALAAGIGIAAGFRRRP